MITPGVERIEIDLDGKQLLVIRGQVTERDTARISEQIGDWLKSANPLLVLAVDTGTSVELVKISGAEKAQGSTPFLTTDAIEVITELVRTSVATPNLEDGSFEWAWNELTDRAQEKTAAARHKALDFLKKVGALA